MALGEQPGHCGSAWLQVCASLQLLGLPLLLHQTDYFYSSSAALKLKRKGCEDYSWWWNTRSKQDERGNKVPYFECPGFTATTRYGRWRHPTREMTSSSPSPAADKGCSSVHAAVLTGRVCMHLLFPSPLSGEIHYFYSFFFSPPNVDFNNKSYPYIFHRHFCSPNSNTTPFSIHWRNTRLRLHALNRQLLPCCCPTHGTDTPLTASWDEVAQIMLINMQCE